MKNNVVQKEIVIKSCVKNLFKCKEVDISKSDNDYLINFQCQDFRIKDLIKIQKFCSVNIIAIKSKNFQEVSLHVREK